MSASRVAFYFAVLALALLLPVAALTCCALSHPVIAAVLLGAWGALLSALDLEDWAREGQAIRCHFDKRFR